MTHQELVHEFQVVAAAAAKLGVKNEPVAAECKISVSLLSAYRTGSRVPPKDKRELIIRLIQSFRKQTRARLKEVNEAADKVLPKK